MSATRRGLRAALALPVMCILLAACIPSEPAEPPRLDEAEIVLPGFDSLRVRLADGVGEVTGPDGARMARAGLTEWRVQDDLDGDGRPDALVVGWSNGGGSGTFVELMHFVLSGEDRSPAAWVWTGAVPLGDRVRIRALTVTDRRIEVHLTEHGPDDPLCCPTVEAVRAYEVSDGTLEEAGRR